MHLTDITKSCFCISFHVPKITLQPLFPFPSHTFLKPNFSFTNTRLILSHFMYVFLLSFKFLFPCVFTHFFVFVFFLKCFLHFFLFYSDWTWIGYRVTDKERRGKRFSHFLLLKGLICWGYFHISGFKRQRKRKRERRVKKPDIFLKH